MHSMPYYVFERSSLVIYEVIVGTENPLICLVAGSHKQVVDYRSIPGTCFLTSVIKLLAESNVFERLEYIFYYTKLDWIQTVEKLRRRKKLASWRVFRDYYSR